MRTIAIVNEKGGTGKTTTAVNLSAALGELQQRVLLVDLDGQAASSRWLGVEDDTSFADALWRGEGLRPIADVVPGVSLAPGSGKLDSVSHDLRPTQGGQLRKLLAQASGFDYAVIDCPPSLGNRLIGNALLAATEAVVPVETSILALDGLKILLTTLQDVRDGFGHDIALAGVLACRYDVRTKLSRLVLAELKRALPGKVFETVIRENVRMRECPGSGKSILEYAPDCHAAEDYRALAAELLAMPVPARQLASGDQGFSQRDLTEEERTAVSQMREQVDIMLRGLNSRSRRKTPAPSELAAEAPIKTPAEVAALATYAALEGQQQPQPAEPAPQGEVPSPIIVPPPEDAPATQPQELAPPDAATGEPAADLAESAFTPEPPAGDAPEPAPQVQEQAEHSLQPTFQDEPSWDQGPGQAQTIEPQPQLEDVSPQQDSQLVPSSPPPGEQSPSASEPTQADSAAAEATASWETQAEAPEAPEQATAASEPSPQPQGNTEDTWEIGPLEQEEEPAVQHVDPEDALSREVAPEESEDDAPVAATQETPPDEAEAPGEAQTDASDEQEDYPALRRLLREMSGQSEPDESDPPQADQPDEQDSDSSGWREAFHKPAGVK